MTAKSLLTFESTPVVVQAVKAMRFEPDAHKKLVEDAEARKERLAQEQELAKAMQEEEDEDAF